MWGSPITINLPYEADEDKEIRNEVSSIITKCWEALNKWTMALNTGLSSLKYSVSILSTAKHEEELPITLHESSAKLDSSILIMVEVVRTLQDAKDQLQNLIDCEERKCPGKSTQACFLTMPLFRFVEIIDNIQECYKNETAVKQSALNPLSSSRNQDTLNHCITIWSTQAYLPHPHLFDIKMLLREIGQFT